jgi:hypothetical protein
MRLVTFMLAVEPRIGIVDSGGGRVFDLMEASKLDGRTDRDFAPMLSLIDAGSHGGR